MEDFENWLNSFNSSKEAIDNVKEYAIYILLTATNICKDNLETLSLVKAAVELNPSDPRLNNNLATIYFKLNKLDLALEASKKALASGLLECYITNSIILGKMEDYSGAKDSLTKALKLSPNSAAIHKNLSQLCYKLGQFGEFLYEGQWNNILNNGKPFITRFHDVWDGKADLSNKKVLVFNEHGFGDILHYCRYIQYIKQDNVHITLEVDDSQVEVFKCLNTIDEVIGREEFIYAKEPRVDYDYAVSAASLIYYFDPDFKNIQTEPYLQVYRNLDNPGVKKVNSSNKTKIGIIWAGNQWHINDFYRSCHLKYFEPLSKIKNIQLFGLQKGKMQRSYPLPGETWYDGGDLNILDLMEGSENVNYIDLSEYIDTFRDTAEILKSLDLLITVDSSIGHLAGAIGVPTWLLLPTNYDWRWHYKWYENHKVFTQDKLGDWESVFSIIADKLTPNF